ncbi:hypothetical protein AVEN_187062-1 [Araneus ventricosus]|uniref:Uncharacterized protein n=1 Tax=Araneus ventricosus TaxID=182803 RepID=A0A4Y2P7G1_ARAVE|nr:hypothetical protein AVEN_187062-1 [Araneus ventricosus]
MRECARKTRRGDVCENILLLFSSVFEARAVDGDHPRRVLRVGGADHRNGHRVAHEAALQLRHRDGGLRLPADGRVVGGGHRDLVPNHAPLSAAPHPPAAPVLSGGRRRTARCQLRNYSGW